MIIFIATNITGVAGDLNKRLDVGSSNDDASDSDEGANLVCPEGPHGGGSVFTSRSRDYDEFTIKNEKNFLLISDKFFWNAVFSSLLSFKLIVGDGAGI